MSEPVIADTKPVVMELEPGTYYWCRCGGVAVGDRKVSHFATVPTRAQSLCPSRLK
jgi:hypothetical protein